MIRVLAVLAALATVASAAGCGGSGAPKPSTALGTAPCLKTKGFTHVTTDPLKIGLIAAAAENGGLQARTSDGNVLTIAFASDANGATATEKAFRNHAPPKLRPHMADIMSAQDNAVLVWTVTPTQQQLADAESCLHS